MRKFLLLTGLLTVMATPALACKCDMANTAQGNAYLNDSSLTLADVFVRGKNDRIGQSMLDIKTIKHGGLTAQNIRAKYNTHSCGTIPQYKQTQTVVIKFEPDGTYSLADQCTKALMEQSYKAKGQ